MVVDKSNMLSVLDNFPAQCKHALALPEGITIPQGTTSVVVIGMGGSGIGGDLLRTYAGTTTLPVFVVRDYRVPNFVDEYSAVFSCSYSGNTEETLAATEDAKSKGAKIIAITSGGKLSRMADRVITVPSGLQPRAALGYMFFPMVGVLYNSGLLEVSNESLNEMMALLKNQAPIKKEAEQIASFIHGKLPIIYASEAFGPVALRWKTQINENAKLPAFSSTFSEMNHNEICAYTHVDRDLLAPVLLRNPRDNPRIRKRMDITKKIMEQRTKVYGLEIKGNSLLARLFYAIYVGDYASYFLALKDRTDPTPVEVIEALKKELV